MSGRLQGKVAVVTGGGRGIGAAACERFAEEGANVVAVDVDADNAKETAADIEDAGGPRALGIGCDVSDEAEVEAMAATVEDEFGGVDVLVNNAGVRNEPMPVTEASQESWERILGINLLGMAFCSKHCIPLMDDGGSVINNASVGAGKARAKWAQYDSTKGAIIAATKDMACDHAAEGIRVNAVSPGWVITEYHVMDNDPEDPEAWIEEKTSYGGSEGSILKRAARPRELADAFLWLASDESSFVTGVNIPVDGGSSVN